MCLGTPVETPLLLSLRLVRKTRKVEHGRLTWGSTCTFLGSAEGIKIAEELLERSAHCVPHLRLREAIRVLAADRLLGQCWPSLWLAISTVVSRSLGSCVKSSSLVSRDMVPARIPSWPRAVMSHRARLISMPQC